MPSLKTKTLAEHYEFQTKSIRYTWVMLNLTEYFQWMADIEMITAYYIEIWRQQNENLH